MLKSSLFSSILLLTSLTLIINNDSVIAQDIHHSHVHGQRQEPSVRQRIALPLPAEELVVGGPDSTQEPAEVVAHGTVESRLYIDLTNAEIRQIRRVQPRFFTDIRLMGWHQKGNRLYSASPATGLQLQLDGRSVAVEAGRYALVESRAKAHIKRHELKSQMQQEGASAVKNRIKVFYMGHELPAGSVEVLSAESGERKDSAPRLNLTVNFEFRSWREQMHKSHGSWKQAGEHHHAQTSSNGNPMDVRCLDYNGPFSDGGNYPKTHWRAFMNFVGSDCDLSFISCGALCAKDHMVGGCATNHKKLCSAIINHSTSYHKHTKLDVALFLVFRPCRR